MLNVGIIGIGNAGNQVAALAKEKLNIPVMAINSTEKDLETVPDGIPKKLIISGEGASKQGSGKDRTLAKKYLKSSIMSLIASDDFQKLLNDLDEVFIVSSTGGGTGSGTAPLMAMIINQSFPDLHTILVGITPVTDDAYSTHVNSLQYLEELYDKLDNPTYMLYDNDKLAGLSSYLIMEKVNNEIVEDIDVLRCRYNYTTKYESIDDKDMTRLISFGGRIVVCRLQDFKEKDCDTIGIEEMLISNIKSNCHVELQRDKKVMATGIITNLSKTLTEEFNNNIPKVREFTGEPIHAFSHIYVNEERTQPNNVFLIMSGLTPVNDKMFKISDRIQEIDERQKTMEDENALKTVEMESLTNKITDKKEENTRSQVDLKDIFAKFDV